MSRLVTARTRPPLAHPRSRHFARAAALFASFLAVLAAAGAAIAAESEPGEKEAEAWNVQDPPGEWRTVSIDTRTTTWSNLDVGPDGRTIVFDMLGDLYTVPIEGGEATPLTQDIAWNFQPRFSPDGRWIAFISDRGGGDNLWLMQADGGGEPRALTEESEHLVHNPAFSPDGDYIAVKKGFTSTRSIPAGEIWLVHVGGGSGVQLVERPHGPQSQKNIAEPAFSPDGRYVYYSQDTTPGRVWEYNKDSTGQIFVIQRLDRETGEVETFVDGPGGAVRPTPSPDGRWLAFVRRLPGLTSAIYVKDLASGRELPLVRSFERDLQETNGSQGNAPAFAWTPDATSIVYWSGGTFHRADVATGEIRDIPVHVRAEMKVAETLRFPVEVEPDRFTVRMPRWARVTPDGRRVVFQALGVLWVTDLETGARRRLTEASDHFELFPALSRDGRWVAYTTWDDDDLGSVRVVSIDGGSERILTPEPGHYVEPSFSPDGRLVAYRKTTGGFLLAPFWSQRPGLWVAPADGSGAPRRVLDRGRSPHFGGDAERLFFVDSPEPTKLALESVDLDGHDERKHLVGSDITSFAVSPDGRWVAFTQQYDAWIAPLPVTGRTVEISKTTGAIPVRRVSRRAGDFLHWAGDASALYWSHGPTVFTRKLADAFAFLEGAPDPLPEPVDEGWDISFPVPTDRPTGAVAVVGGRVITMRGAREGTREVIDDGVVVIDGSRIAAVGRRGEVEIPTGAFVLDARGKTVIPGLVDVHAHGAQAREEIVPQQNWMQYSNLAFGVTTIHDPSNDTTEIFAASEMQKAGAIVAPRIFSTGTILYGADLPGYKDEIDDLDDARFHVRRLAEVGAISVKSYQQPRRDQRQQIIAAGREFGIMVVPEGGAKFQHNMTEIVDGHTGIEHAIPLRTAYDDVVQLWSATQTGYTPTLGVAYGGISGENYWYDRTDVWRDERLMRYSPRFIVEPRSMRRTKAPDDHYNHIDVARFAHRLRKAGVSVQVGAHGQREGLAAHWEIWMLVQGGFSPWEALRAATIDGAFYLGLDGDIGSIEAGKLADLVVIDANPLDDIRASENVAYTLLGGRIYEAATMNRIGPDAREREPFFFERPGGDTVHPQTWRWLEGFLERHGCRH